MEINDLFHKPLFLMTGEEFIFLQKNAFNNNTEKKGISTPESNRNLVYGIQGIATLFKCSIPTAQRIKNSGVIMQAITQVGRKIIVDSDKALELAGRKSGGRTHKK